jgi:hypothetical protein
MIAYYISTKFCIVIKFSDFFITNLQQINLTAMIDITENIVESGVKHHKPTKGLI